MNTFDSVIGHILPDGLWSDGIGSIQVNIGRYCNLSCRHCHLECAPSRKELMPWENMERVLGIVQASRYELVDITGGSPELHPRFFEFVDKLRLLGQTVQVRTNLVSLMETGRKDVTGFLKERRVKLVGSLPCYLEENVDSQRGPGVYKKSIKAILMLNDMGYGRTDGLSLNLVFNPGGSFLPAAQSELEAVYKHELGQRFGISFNKLLVLANMPIGRFRRELETIGRLEDYMAYLRRHFNQNALGGLMCRNQVSIDWDGRIYDCDFNIALGITTNHGAPSTLEEYDRRLLSRRKIMTGNHCFGCTAGQGSSCSGSLQ